MTKLLHLLEQNQRWAAKVLKEDEHFFERLTAVQRPEYLWIGCSDSRVPANQITGLVPGEVFVHRNVGNIVGDTDLNCLSVLQYAVEMLGVRHIIVCGHYGCGAIQAAWDDMRFGVIDVWLSSVKRIKDRHMKELDSLEDTKKKIDRLCELNVLGQANNLCRTSVIQDAWAKGKDLTVHGWIYGIGNGRLKELGFCASSQAEVSRCLEETLAPQRP